MVWVPGPVATSGRKPTVLGGVLMNDDSGLDGGAYATGPVCVVAKAGATLLIGDAVFWSAAFTVNKSTTAGDRLKRAGFVVGGVPRSMADYTLEALLNALDIGEIAGNVNDTVLVAVGGIAIGIADSAIAAGAQVTFSATTAGRLVASATAAVTDAMGVVGTTIDASAANADKLRVLVSY